MRMDRLRSEFVVKDRMLSRRFEPLSPGEFYTTAFGSVEHCFIKTITA